MDVLPVDDMSLEEIKERLLRAFRKGDLSIDLTGPVLGFARAMKRGNPSAKQIGLARKLVQEVRYLDGTEPVNLIDDGDTIDDGPDDAQATMWETL